MKRLKHITLLTTALIALAIGCKDDKLNPYVPPQGNAHGFGQFTSQYDNTTLLPQFGNNQFYDQTAIDRVVFFDGNATSANQRVDFQLQWQSIDNRIKISTIELFVEYDETYTDAARNPQLASHGGKTRAELGNINPTTAPGVFWKSIPAGDARVSQPIAITGDDVYSLFQNKTFDYDGAGPNPPVNIFTGHPYNSAAGFNRSTAATRFLPNRTYTIPGVGDVALAADVFRINWRLIADDGTAYASWSPGVCSSVVGATCFGQWRVASNVFNPRVTVTRETGAKPALRAGDVTTLRLTYAVPPIATSVAVSAPTVAIGTITGFSGSRGVLGAVTATSSPNVYTVDYTAPAGLTAPVTINITGATSASSAPKPNLVQVAGSQTLTIDNTAPFYTALPTTGSVGRGGSRTFTFSFSEPVTSPSASPLRLSITGQQGLDDISGAAGNLTLASDGLSASYLYIWRDSDSPFNNTHGNVTVNVTGGADLAGNALSGANFLFVNDQGRTEVFVPPTGPNVNVSGVVNAPVIGTITDRGGQFDWSITHSTGNTPAGAAFGTVAWTILRWVDTNSDGVVNASDTPPTIGQAFRSVAGVTNQLYNGFGPATPLVVTGGNTSPATPAVVASGTVTASSTVTSFTTPLTAKGRFSLFVWVTTPSGNTSANTAGAAFTMQN